ncbi:MAG: hypothetical protein WC158_02245, partial [Candidatus Paceibacterota bacterium]
YPKFLGISPLGNQRGETAKCLPGRKNKFCVLRRKKVVRLTPKAIEGPDKWPFIFFLRREQNSAYWLAKVLKAL